MLERGLGLHDRPAPHHRYGDASGDVLEALGHSGPIDESILRATSDGLMGGGLNWQISYQLLLTIHPPATQRLQISPALNQTESGISWEISGIGSGFPSAMALARV